MRVLATPAVTTLSHAAFRVMALLAAQYRGRNNGNLGLTYGQAANAGIASKNTFYNALRQLEEHGLIERTYPSSRVPARPTMYALAWWPLDDTEYSQSTRLASHAYKEWQPSQPKQRRKAVKLTAVK